MCLVKVDPTTNHHRYRPESNIHLAMHLAKHTAMHPAKHPKQDATIPPYPFAGTQGFVLPANN